MMKRFLVLAACLVAVPTIAQDGLIVTIPELNDRIDRLRGERITIRNARLIGADKNPGRKVGFVSVIDGKGGVALAILDVSRVVADAEILENCKVSTVFVKAACTGTLSGVVRGRTESGNPMLDYITFKRTD
jgi:hypothetical protein